MNTNQHNDHPESHNKNNPGKGVNDHQMDHYDQLNLFDLRFFVSSFAGYGLHTKNMLTLHEFRKLLNLL